MRTRTFFAVLAAGLMVAMPVAGLPLATDDAAPSAADATSTTYPTPGLNCELTDPIPAVGRYFPEAMLTNDYIGYFEAVQCLERIEREHPNLVEVHRPAKSLGWVNALTGQREPHDILLIEVTNEESHVPFDEKIQLLFMCSIHGNEKGGREGCLRVIEDFARGIGMAQSNPELVRLLDYMLLIFIIQNTDGWTHDEPEYFASSPGTMYTRGNANGTDLNRQFPTMGFMQHQSVREPEIRGSVNFMQERYTNVHYASDIHGMINPADLKTPPNMPSDCNPAQGVVAGCQGWLTEFQQWLMSDEKGHYLLSLLPAGQLTQAQQIRMTRLSELLKERTDNCGGGLLAPTWCAFPADVGVWGGRYNHWGTVWETINYQISGGSHDWMMSPYGLGAPAVSFEMSYNHIVCDGVYTGCGQFMNDFHINTVRVIVATFMEAAKTDFQVSIDSKGLRTGYLYNPLVVTNLDENGQRIPSGGWADRNEYDDQWDVLHNTYLSSPNDYLRDLAEYVIDGETRGVFDEVQLSQLTPERLALYDNFVIAGSAYNQLGDGHKEVLKQWVESGGKLVVTDESMKILPDFGLAAPDAVRQINRYVGHTEILDYTHPIAKDLIGYSRQTYEPVPIGHAMGSSPVWVVDTSAVEQHGRVVGVVPQPGVPRLDESQNTNLGEVTLGAGTVRFLGALVPDPSYELYTPYGVASYGVTYAGNQFFINLLDMDLVFRAPPLVLDDTGNLRKVEAPRPSTGAPMDGGDEQPLETGGRSPAPGLLFGLLAALGAALVIQRRRA